MSTSSSSSGLIELNVLLYNLVWRLTTCWRSARRTGGYIDDKYGWFHCKQKLHQREQCKVTENGFSTDLRVNFGERDAPDHCCRESDGLTFFIQHGADGRLSIAVFDAVRRGDVGILTKPAQQREFVVGDADAMVRLLSFGSWHEGQVQ